MFTRPMHELLDQIDRWLARGEQVALATVVRTMGSSPRQVGAQLAVSSGGGMVGSVSGGCIEGAVFEECQTALRTQTARLLQFGVADETAWEVGLACGGEIQVLVQPLVHYAQLRTAVQAGQPLATATVIAGREPLGRQILVEPAGRYHDSFGDVDLEARVAAVAQTWLGAGTTGLYQDPDQQVTVFIASLVPPPVLYLVGGVHIAVALAPMARLAGFRTVVVDARAAFASPERFDHADELLVAWPDEALAGRLDARSAVAVLTHDPKLDDPALRVALASPARYVGALGSKTTHQRRLERLRAEGLSEAQLARIHGPIGLALGAKTPAEIAVSILAEIVQVWRAA
ncbi:MAG: XdhC family protein [Oscillochloridaceae bacterium umkhey_bin13]